MKLCFFLVPLLGICATAMAQDETVPTFVGHDLLRTVGGRYNVTGQYVPLYLPGDTVAAAQHASQGERLPVQAMGSRWALVYKTGKHYFMRKEYLNLPGALALGPDSVAVPRDPATGLIRYSGEAVAPGSQAELMGRAKVWFATGFRTKEVMQVQDAATGALVGKAFSEVFIHAPEPNTHRLDYTIQITCRDGGYRYVISSFGFGQYLGSYGGVSGTPAERVIFDTKYSGKQRAIIIKHKTELYRVALDVQQQLRAAMGKPVGS